MIERLLAIRLRIEAAWERGASWAASVVPRIRPRISLASGSVLVLLTLFLPVTVDSCGKAAGPGYELALGRPNHYWPSFLFFSESMGRVLYLTSLALAIVTVLLVLGLLLRTGLTSKRRLHRALFAVAGTLSLFTLSDFFILQGFVTDDWHEGPSGAVRLTVTVATVLLAVVAVFGPGLFWPRRLFAVWLIAFPFAHLVLLTCVRAARFIGWNTSVQESWLAVPIWVYYLMPLFLWYWKGLLRRREADDHWPRIRLGLACLYTPAAAANCLLLIYACQEKVWGLVPYVAGIHLISLGYMRLAQMAERPLTERGASP